MNEKRTIAKSCTLWGLVVVVVALCNAFPNAATNWQTGMWLRLPESVPGHIVREREPDKEELDILPSDTGIVKRSYIPRDAESPYEWVHATLILSGNDPRSLHKPSVCLDAQGWVITDKQVKKLEVNGHDLEVMDYTMYRDQKNEGGELVRIHSHYVYWWIGKDRSTPHDWKRIVFTDLDNLLRNVNNRWGYPSVMVQVDPEQEDGEEVARERAYDWIREHAPHFQKSLADPPADSSRS